MCVRIPFTPIVHGSSTLRQPRDASENGPSEQTVRNENRWKLGRKACHRLQFGRMFTFSFDEDSFLRKDIGISRRRWGVERESCENIRIDR